MNIKRPVVNLQAFFIGICATLDFLQLNFISGLFLT